MTFMISSVFLTWKKRPHVFYLRNVYYLSCLCTKKNCYYLTHARKLKKKLKNRKKTNSPGDGRHTTARRGPGGRVSRSKSYDGNNKKYYVALCTMHIFTIARPYSNGNNNDGNKNNNNICNSDLCTRRNRGLAGQSVVFWCLFLLQLHRHPHLPSTRRPPTFLRRCQIAWPYAAPPMAVIANFTTSDTDVGNIAPPPTI